MSRTAMALLPVKRQERSGRKLFLAGAPRNYKVIFGYPQNEAQPGSAWSIHDRVSSFLRHY
jgi:hypothetical protein